MTIKYVVFNGNTVGATYSRRIDAFRCAQEVGGNLTIGEVEGDRILRMWKADKTPMEFISHGGDQGEWRARI